MSQNIPPNQDQQDPNNPYASQDAQDQYQGNQQAQGNSPYAYQQTQPNLDANAPALTSNELQRINRKAMFFLAGIILLLLAGAAWLLSSASSKDDVEKPKEEAVSIPTLPETPLATEEPIPLAEPEPAQPTVILPPEIPPPPPEQASTLPAGPPQPRGPTLAERRMANIGSDSPQQGSGVDPNVAAMLAAQQGMQPGTQNAGGESKNKSESAGATRAQFITNADSLLVRGTYIRCVLETKIITDLPGFTSCVVTEPVYSINGKTLLLPKGSKMLGSYDVEDPKFPRVSVIWDRITTPNGIDVSMASPGVDNLGAAGHPGSLNSHWGSKLSSALLISLVSDAFKYFGEKEGPQSQTVTTGGQVITTPYESNTAKTVQKFADRVVERNLSRPATVTINQGAVINVYVAKDVSFANVVGR
jgi:type IV secretion system protein VirB10